MSIRQQFLQHIAQTSPNPIGLEMANARGVYITDIQGRHYIDGISGFSVANIGHGHPAVIQAVQQQAQQYMHLIVYGEFIQQPQVSYATILTQHLPTSLNCVYFANSGTEAIEGALKLAKRVTAKTKIIAFNNAYHGSTQGALSIMGGEYFKQAYRPLLPNVFNFDFGSEEAILAIDEHTACVVLEPVQAEAGIIAAQKVWLQQVQQQCKKHNCVLIFDEVQSGFGRTGKLWAFEHYGVVPDILVLGKALGGGMPLGAFIADYVLMQTLTNNPVLGHITTFGGHPVSCAAGKAAFEILLQTSWIEDATKKEAYLLSKLQHPNIKNINHCGLWLAIELANKEAVVKAAANCIQNGLITDWFLFNENCLRIAPPLCISYDELDALIKMVLQSI